MVACSGGGQTEASGGGEATTPSEPATQAATDNGLPDNAIKEVELTNPLDQAMIEEGRTISDMKCMSCHRLDETRIVGPGWKGITKNRAPEWIMNMITNVDMMLAEDEEAQKLLEECLVRMPNQNIKVSEARSILEYMRQNDGEE